MIILNQEVREWFKVRISGVSSSPSNLVLEDCIATVATISDDGYIKIWPEDDHLGDGKIWIPMKDITDIEILDTDE